MFNGTCSFACDRPLPSFTFTTDACKSGDSAFLLDHWFYSSWLVDFPAMQLEHINIKELFTVVLALRRWGQNLRNKHIIVHSSNMATVTVLRSNTSRSNALMPLIREIFWHSVENNITLSSCYIPGNQNLLPDRISRLASPKEAYDARLLLASFTIQLVACHMSWQSFYFLQGIWTPILSDCVGRLRSSMVHPG